MASAYAAVVSLMHLMEQIKMYNIRKRIFFEEHQSNLESLSKKICLLQDYLESYSSNGDEGVEGRIRDAASAAEDIIELYLVSDIHYTSKLKGKGKGPIIESYVNRRFTSISNDFLQKLLKVIEDLDLIEKEVIKIKEKSKLEGQPLGDLVPISSLSRHPNSNDAIVGLESDLKQMMHKVKGQHSNRQIIPITGMGGIGKTTLAKKVYTNRSVEQYFEIRGWITVSQDNDIVKMLLSLAQQIQISIDQGEKESPQYLGEKLHKHLYRRRYLIVLDDVWSLEAWDKLQLFLPDDSNGSRIIVTTRLSNVANNFGSSNLHKMDLLDDDTSWSLLFRQVFAEESCPPEFEKVGKKIARSCNGLPLALVVIGGLLVKYKTTVEYWERVAIDVSMTVNSEDDDRCFKILSLSYSLLPIYLKPCFLYMGVFPEDQDIRVSRLIKLWVGEGFLKPDNSKTLEQVAEDYLKELIDRNLILVSEYGSTGRIKICKIHDLLRDLCVREAEKEMFLCIIKNYDPSQGISSHRRIAVHHGVSSESDHVDIFSTSNENSSAEISHAMQSAPFLRSLICDVKLNSNRFSFKLLRVLYMTSYCYLEQEDALKQVNSRYLEVDTFFSILSPSICRLWNLQTLYIRDVKVPTAAPLEIWEMSQLRHLMVGEFYLPDPPSIMETQDSLALENLQTLRCVLNFRLTETVLKRIPNITRLRLKYVKKGQKEFSGYSLKNLIRLHKLQSLRCSFRYENFPPTRTDLLQNIEFPQSLKKLTLRGFSLDWEDVTLKIGWLPNLEKLILYGFFTEVWNPIEGQFLRLKYLGIESTNLACWTAESVHFPCLMHLFLDNMKKLEEIPSGIGEIDTLRSIHLEWCKDSLVASAEKILEEQRDLGNEDLHIFTEFVIDENFQHEFV